MRVPHLLLATLIAASDAFWSSAASADNSREVDSQRPLFTQVQRVHGTIVDVAVGNPAFSTLVTALQAADLVTTLQGRGPFTVFAPTNEAFAKIPPALLNYLLANPDELGSVLAYHVVPGARDLRFQFKTRDLKTVQGQEVYAEREANRLSVNNSLVTGKVIHTDNGVIYVIDSVLLPQYR